MIFQFKLRRSKKIVERWKRFGEKLSAICFMRYPFTFIGFNKQTVERFKGVRSNPFERDAKKGAQKLKVRRERNLGRCKRTFVGQNRINVQRIDPSLRRAADVDKLASDVLRERLVFILRIENKNP